MLAVNANSMQIFRVGSCFLLLKRIPLLPSLTDPLHANGLDICCGLQTALLFMVNGVF
jgi:hypothetical protein